MNNTEIEYWSKFYNSKNISLENSQFSEFVVKYIKDNINNIKNNNLNDINILDLGCGNGKDTYYISKYFNIIGIDSSNKPKDTNSCKFIKGDFIKYDKSNTNILYSRFTLHSITDELQNELLKSIKKGSYLFIETRSDKGIDSIRIYGDNHYRNFTNFKKLKEMLSQHNFKILYDYEGIDCAIYKDENPICIRIVCYKS
jgi:tellurite methyltransferase